MTTAIKSLAMRCHVPTLISILFLSNDQRSDIVASFLIMLGMRSVTIGKFLALPASTEDGFATQIFYVHFVNHFATVHLDEVVASSAGRLDWRRRRDQALFVEEFQENRLLLLVDLGGGVSDEGEAPDGRNEGEPIAN